MENFITVDVKESKDDTRVITFVITDDTKDRYNEILTIDGWDMKAYKRNPVFLWAHKQSEPPIGKGVKIYKEDGKWQMDVEFISPDIYPFADTIYKMYKAKFLSAVSVGFLPDYSKSEYDEATGTLVTHKKELLEVSAVPVPANPNALTQRGISEYMEKGLTEKDIVAYKKAYDSIIESPASLKAELETLKAELSTLRVEIDNLKNEDNEDSSIINDLQEVINAFRPNTPSESTNDNDLASMIDKFKITIQ